MGHARCSGNVAKAGHSSLSRKSGKKDIRDFQHILEKRDMRDAPGTWNKKNIQDYLEILEKIKKIIFLFCNFGHGF